LLNLNSAVGNVFKFLAYFTQKNPFSKSPGGEVGDFKPKTGLPKRYGTGFLFARLTDELPSFCFRKPREKGLSRMGKAGNLDSISGNWWLKAKGNNFGGFWPTAYLAGFNIFGRTGGLQGTKKPSKEIYFIIENRDGGKTHFF